MLAKIMTIVSNFVAILCAGCFIVGPLLWIYPPQQGPTLKGTIAYLVLSAVVGHALYFIFKTYAWVKEMHDERHTPISTIAREIRQKYPGQRPKRNKKYRNGATNGKKHVP